MNYFYEIKNLIGETRGYVSSHSPIRIHILIELLNSGKDYEAYSAEPISNEYFYSIQKQDTTADVCLDGSWGEMRDRVLIDLVNKFAGRKQYDYDASEY